MADEYDVIIIGTGAGGGTLAHTLAPSGKRILLLERGDFLPREMDNWNPDAVFIDGKYVSRRHLVRQRRGALPASGPLFRGRGDQALRRRPVPAATAGFRGDRPRGWACRRRGRSTMTSSSPGTPRPSGCTRCTAPGMRTLPRGTGPSLIPGRRSATRPASRRSATPSRRAATIPSRLRSGSCSTRRIGPGAPVSAAPGATAIPAWCTPSPTPR